MINGNKQSGGLGVGGSNPLAPTMFSKIYVELCLFVYRAVDDLEDAATSFALTETDPAIFCRSKPPERLEATQRNFQQICNVLSPFRTTQ